MSTQEAQASAPWSLMAPTAAGPRAAVGRAEDVEEARRFDTAMRQAETAAARSTEAVDPARAIQLGRPDEREFAASEIPSGDAFFGEDGFTVGDLIDIVNPLQHIPGVSTVYRAMTGDEMSPGARLAGGTLFGGPFGAASAIANNVSEDLTGQDIGGNVMAAFTGGAGDDGSVLAAAPATAETMDDAATLAAAVAPAGAAGSRTVAPITQGAGQDTGQATAQGTAGNPFFASQPTGAPFAVMPTGASPVAPPTAEMAVMARAQAQTPTATQPQTQTMTETQSPVTAAATGVPRLSPEAANVLMRMSRESAVPASAQAPIQPPPIQPPPATTPPATTQATTQATSPPAPSTASASQAPAGSASVPGTTQTAGFIETVPAEDLPAAMMEALAKYQEMKAGQ